MSATIRSPQTVCKDVLKAIPERTRKKAIAKTVRFSNDEIPVFLQKLNRFESQSSKKDYALR